MSQSLGTRHILEALSQNNNKSSLHATTVPLIASMIPGTLIEMARRYSPPKKVDVRPGGGHNTWHMRFRHVTRFHSFGRGAQDIWPWLSLFVDSDVVLDVHEHLLIIA